MIIAVEKNATTKAPPKIGELKMNTTENINPIMAIASSQPQPRTPSEPSSDAPPIAQSERSMIQKPTKYISTAVATGAGLAASIKPNSRSTIPPLRVQPQPCM